MPAHQLQVELAIPAYQHDPSASARLRPRARKRVTGMARPCAHNAARPHLQRSDRGVDGPGAGDDGPPAAGRGGTCCLRTSCRASSSSQDTRTCKAVPTRTHQVAQTSVQARAPKFLAWSLLSQSWSRSCPVTASQPWVDTVFSEKTVVRTIFEIFCTAKNSEGLGFRGLGFRV